MGYLFYCFKSIDVKKNIDKNIGWCLTFVGVYTLTNRGPGWLNELGRWI